MPQLINHGRIYYSKEAITASIPELTAYQYMVSQNQDNSKTKYILRKI